MRTRRAFKAMLVWDKEAGKVGFEFAPSKFPPRKTAAKAAAPATAKATPATRAAAAGAGRPTAKSAAGKTVAKKTPAKKAAGKTAASAKTAKAAPARIGTLQPSPALAAVIGNGLVARTEVVKKIWDYIKAHGLQDAANKRAINSDAKLLKVFGKTQVTMFELAGLIGKHLT